MALGYENPSLLYKLIDNIGNNLLFSFVYTNYIKTLNLSGSEMILDFGSGSGAGSKHLAKILKNGNGHLTCVDISLYWTEKAKKRLKKYDNVDFFIGQLSDLEFNKNSFDIIYVHYTLHDIPENFRNQIAKEFFRILKPDGKIYLKEPQRPNDGMSVSEIRKIMSSNKFIEKTFKRAKETFSAVYVKK